MPRISEYGKSYGVRFKKKVEKELTKYCIEREVNPSTPIQEAVECFLMNPKCKARRRTL